MDLAYLILASLTAGYVLGYGVRGWEQRAEAREAHRRADAAWDGLVRDGCAEPDHALGVHSRRVAAARADVDAWLDRPHLPVQRTPGGAS